MKKNPVLPLYPGRPVFVVDGHDSALGRVPALAVRPPSENDLPANPAGPSFRRTVDRPSEVFSALLELVDQPDAARPGPRDIEASCLQGGRIDGGGSRGKTGFCGGC